MKRATRQTRRHPNPPEAEAICQSLWTLQEGCEALLERHRRGDGQDCHCELCNDARGLLFFVNLAAPPFEDRMRPWPAKAGREAAGLRAEGRPDLAAAWDLIGRRLELGLA